MRVYVQINPVQKLFMEAVFTRAPSSPDVHQLTSRKQIGATPVVEYYSAMTRNGLLKQAATRADLKGAAASKGHQTQTSDALGWALEQQKPGSDAEMRSAVAWGRN